MSAFSYKLYTFFALALALAASACDGRISPPTAPTPTPTPAAVTVTVVDGLTLQAVSGGNVLHNGRTVPLQDGSAELQDVRVGDRITVNVPGYRDRNTLYCGSPSILMWPNQGDVDEAISRMAYMDSGEMARPDALFLLPSEEFESDSRAMAALREAISRVTAAVEGRTPVSVVDAHAGAGTFMVFVDQTRSGAQVSYGNVIAGRITGGTITFGTRLAPNHHSVGTIMHEVTHALGVAGHNPYPGIMRAGSGLSNFTPAERKVLLLRYTRPLMARFEGDDDRMVACHLR